MPTFARSTQINLDATPYYHCVARCVRRAFLCGDDPYTGENFDHRKPWFLTQLKRAAEVFAIDICAFAIMSNHFHVVLRVDADRAAGWSDEAVLRRYAKFFPLAARAVRELPRAQRRTRIDVLRTRLTDISWLMRVVCESVARRANREDEVTGRFWEGRFKSQPLLDEAALYTCMSYVDLNPVRAGIATSLDGSDFTSISQRMSQAAHRSVDIPIPLASLRGESRRTSTRATIDFRFEDYVLLLEWTGRACSAKSRATLKGAPTELLHSLGIDASAWLSTMTVGGLSAATALGHESSLAAEASRRDCRWLRGAAAG